MVKDKKQWSVDNWLGMALAMREWINCRRPNIKEQSTKEKDVDDNNCVICVICGRKIMKYAATWNVDFEKKTIEGPFCGCERTKRTTTDRPGPPRKHPPG
jgi:hypothetical protein